ncbi:MAG: sulfate adenylyltransferase [marine bacterium B5-7]|nr:MAG: sulfate adenylyltransferase [marine bacterium B5-7]
MSQLLAPHGGTLVSRLVDDERAEALRQISLELPSWTLNRRQLCDLECLLNGAFSPLRGYHDRSAYESVLDNARLPGGEAWPLPVVLDVDAAFAEKIEIGAIVALRDAEGFMLAVLTVNDKWEADKEREAEAVYGTIDGAHPGVDLLRREINTIYLGGSIEGVQLPGHYEFGSLWFSPAEIRAQFERSGWNRVLAFETSRPIHRVHRDIIVKAAREHGLHILLHPVVGVSKPGDLHEHGRIHCYQAVLKRFPAHMTQLALLPLAMRMAGPRESLLHGLVHQNFGCSHFLVGPDDGSPPDVERGARFYGEYEAQEYLDRWRDELDIEPVFVERHRYHRQQQAFLSASQSKDNGEEVSEGELRSRMMRGEEIPEWVSFPEVLESLSRVYPERNRQGFTLFFTGLSGSGKSTLARIIYAKLVEDGRRPVTLLDGDIVRQNLSSELGFSRAHRDLNIRRIGYVANEITRNGGVAICAPIAPYRDTRRAIRGLIEENGAFIEIHVSTPLEVCEQRDRKGLYAKARKGIIPEFTGVSDPYHVPEHAELVIDTSDISPMEAVQQVLLFLLQEGYIDYRD